ncbi:MAG: DUF3054 domain-containing protein [Haloarculaceae archaeon]
MARGWLGGRVAPTGRTAALLIGDLLAIAAFVLFGMAHHGTIDEPVRVVQVLGSFYVGWIPLAIVAREYAADALASYRRVPVRTLPAWVLAVVVAQALRATRFDPGHAALTFALVSVVVGGALLTGWRLVLASIE